MNNNDEYIIKAEKIWNEILKNSIVKNVTIEEHFNKYKKYLMESTKKYSEKLTKLSFVERSKRDLNWINERNKCAHIMYLNSMERLKYYKLFANNNL